MKAACTRSRLVLSDQDGGEDTAQTQAFLPGARRHDRELQIVGSQGNDIVTVTPSGTTRMFVNVTLQGSGNVRQFYNLVDVDRIVVYVDGGNDRVMVSDRLAIPSVIFGGSGDDHLQGGDGYNLIVGGPGNDTILGGDERDVLIGGTGADQVFGYGGEDVLLGGPANNSSAELETDPGGVDLGCTLRRSRGKHRGLAESGRRCESRTISTEVVAWISSSPRCPILSSTIRRPPATRCRKPSRPVGWQPVVGVPGVYRTVVDMETKSDAVTALFCGPTPEIRWTSMTISGLRHSTC